LQVKLQAQSEGVGLTCDEIYLLRCDLRQIKVCLGGGALCLGQRQEAVDEVFTTVDGLGDGDTHLLHLLARDVRVAQGNIDLRSDDGERRAKLV